MIVIGGFYRKWVEGFADDWQTKYTSWRTEYLSRYNMICPIFRTINKNLKTAGEDTLEQRNVVNPLKPMVKPAKILSCEEPDIPSTVTVDSALAFFAEFREDSEERLVGTVNLITPILKDQLDIINKSLSDIPPLPPTTVNGFTDMLCSADVVQQQEAMEKAKTCVNPAKLPEDKKVSTIVNIINKRIAALERTADFKRLIVETTKLFNEINKIKQQAESGTLPVPQIT